MGSEGPLRLAPALASPWRTRAHAPHVHTRMTCAGANPTQQHMPAPANPFPPIPWAKDGGRIGHGNGMVPPY